MAAHLRPRVILPWLVSSTAARLAEAPGRELQRLGRHPAGGSALRALELERLDRFAAPPLKIANVLNIRLAADGEASSLEPAHTELHPIAGHNFHGLFAQIFN